MRIKIYDNDDWIKIVDEDNNDNILYEGHPGINMSTLAEIMETINPDMPLVEIIELTT